MHLKRFLQEVSSKVGRPVKRYHVNHAQRLGILSKGKLQGGWQVFNEDHLKEMEHYMETHARLIEASDGK
jgi:hypothetical protein